MTHSSKLWAFFVAAFALTWACQTPGILALRAGVPPTTLMLLLMAVGSAAPSLVALTMQTIERRRGGDVSLHNPTDARPTLGLALIALLFPAAAHLLGSGLLWCLGLYRAQNLLYLPLRPEQIAIAIVAPLGEEYGWRGYALPRMQALLGPLASSVWIGLAWALWHVPTFFVPEARGTTALELCMYLVAFLASSVVYTWLYNAGGRSMRGPLLAHLGIHLDNVFRASKMGDGVLPLTLTSIVLTLMAAGLVVTGRLRAQTG
jgi:membrane protease YdiL (CAAX protease family)